MGLQYKRKSKLGLGRLPVLIQDTSLDSKGYFNITEFPSYFGNGKNLVRLKVSNNKLNNINFFDKLEILELDNNKFTEININNLLKLRRLIIFSNPLYHI